MTVRMRFLGAAGYQIEGPAGRILIDPFLTGNPRAPLRPGAVPVPDVILVTHGAFDHLGDAADIARRTGAPIVCGADVRALLLDGGLPPDQVRATIWGIVVKVRGLVIRPVESHHWSSVRLADGSRVTGTPLGFVVEPEPGVRIYHWGDTAIFGDLRLIGQLYHPTVALIGPTHPKEIAVLDGPGELLTGELSPDEAALAVEWLGASVAVATHYIDHEDPEVAAFLLAVRERSAGTCTAIAPRVGDVIVIEEGLASIDPTGGGSGQPPSSGS